MQRDEHFIHYRVPRLAKGRQAGIRDISSILVLYINRAFAKLYAELCAELYAELHKELYIELRAGMHM